MRIVPLRGEGPSALYNAVHCRTAAGKTIDAAPPCPRLTL